MSEALVVRTERPLDLISEATDSLAAICDLLMLGWSPEEHRRDMHLVDSAKLGTLLGRCERDLREAMQELIARETAAAEERRQPI